MPSLNQRAFIAAAVESVLSQDYVNLELIVADGGSQDGTVEWLARKQTQESRLRWFSGADGGPATALNRALDKARGTIIGWLNSDDLYLPGAVERAVHSLMLNSNWMMVYGQGEHIDGNGKYINTYPTLPAETPVKRFADGCFICQPTVFFKRSMYVLLGSFDQSLKTAFDFEYWIRAFNAFPDRIGFVDIVQAQSRLHSDCITLKMRETVMMESMHVIARYFNHTPAHWMETYLDELIGGRVLI